MRLLGSNRPSKRERFSHSSGRPDRVGPAKAEHTQAHADRVKGHRRPQIV